MAAVTLGDAPNNFTNSPNSGWFVSAARDAAASVKTIKTVKAEERVIADGLSDGR